MMIRSLLVLLLSSLSFSVAVGRDNPYAAMGCHTPVLDYEYPGIDSPEIAPVSGEGGKSVKIIQKRSDIFLVVISVDGDTISKSQIELGDVLKFLSIDPLAEENYGVSPYSFANANPLNFIDPEGLKPTEVEAARIAHYVYQDEEVELLGGWRESSIIDFNLNQDNGLKCMLFERDLSEGKIEYVLAFAGTEGVFNIDLVHDLLQPLGFSSQYHDAMSVAKEASETVTDELTFVGHSLGGGLSAASAYATGGQAITFNAAGVSPFTIYSHKNATIDAYITTNDPLNILLGPMGLGANGRVQYRNPMIKKGPLQGHPIIEFYRGKKSR